MQIPLQRKFNGYTHTQNIYLTSKTPTSISRNTDKKMCFVLALLFLIQASLGNLLSPAELWLCLLSTYLLTPRCVVSLSSPCQASVSEGLPQSPPLSGLILCCSYTAVGLIRFLQLQLHQLHLKAPRND